MDLDDFNMKENIELMNLENMLDIKQSSNKQTIGFNSDTLYNFIEKN